MIYFYGGDRVAKQLIKSIFFGLVVIIICTPFNGIFGEKSLKAIHNICPLNQKLKRGFTETGILTDQLDQYQTEDCGYGIMIFDGYWCAQAFKPSLGILTKVQLYMFRYGNPSNNIQITISIKSSLTGGDLTMAAVYGRQISNQGNWVEFNFPDINVVVGSTYYIVCRASGGNIDNNYCWLFGMNNPYKKGDAWLSDDYGNSWYVFDYPPDFPDADFCFKTYGKEGMQGNYYALIIGISDYPGTENDLPCPAKDALAIKNALLAGNNWHSNNIKFLVNEQASVSNVENALSWLISKETANDVSLIYFCGHSGQIDDKYPYDESDGKDEFLALYDGGWLDDTMAVILNQFNGHVVVILDSCFSGGMPNSLSKVKAEKFTKEFMDDISSPGRIILMASKENEESWEYLPIGHGLFSFYIISGLCGSADSNNDHTITAEETFYYTKPNVEYLWNVLLYPQYPQYHQHPQIYDGIYGQLPILNNILNKPPNKPNKPVGPTYGKRFRIYTYSTSTNDPNGDEIYYFFYWGDRTFSGWIGPYSSGQTVTASHWWFRGTYSIRVMAMDEHGAVSEWSEPLPISIPVTKLDWLFDKLMDLLLLWGDVK